MDTIDIIKEIRDRHSKIFERLAEGPNKNNATNPFQSYAYDLEIALASKIKEVEELKTRLSLTQSRLRRIIR